MLCNWQFDLPASIISWKEEKGYNGRADILAKDEVQCVSALHLPDVVGKKQEKQSFCPL